ncbi:MAG: hypothetical protein LBN25_03000 [Christensenellaceae bacterium]|jgi:hypothetical protein|nr:hypothetical protein [Christensenellaceae bacterium]
MDDFKTLYEKYIKGTASEEEIRYVEDTLSKSDSVFAENSSEDKLHALDEEKLTHADTATIENIKKRIKKKTLTATLLTSLAILGVATAIVLGSVFGAAGYHAKKNSLIDEDEAESIARAFAEEECGVDDSYETDYVHQRLVFRGALKNTYYEHVVEFEYNNREVVIIIDGISGEATLHKAE